jgi:hypothetical protein
MMWHRNTAQNWVFGVLAAFLMCVPGLASAAPSLTPLTHFAIADEPENDADAEDAPRPESPGSVQKHRDGGEPSEDGTDDSPQASPPDNSPPGCKFQGGTLELFV